MDITVSLYIFRRRNDYTVPGGLLNSTH